MRKLTFLGFLKSYLKQLSRQNTLNIRKLVREATTDNLRLREPLFLYALESGKMEILLYACAGTALEKPFQTLANKYDINSMRIDLANDSASLDERFLKVWWSYQSLLYQQRGENHTKKLIRSKILRLQKEKRVSNYRLFTDLGINPGNANAWLKHGHHQKISLECARRILQYLQDR